MLLIIKCTECGDEIGLIDTEKKQIISGDIIFKKNSTYDYEIEIPVCESCLSIRKDESCFDCDS